MQTVKIGDVVKRKPHYINDDGENVALYGTVVYVHPMGRFHVVAFETRHGAVREAFSGIQK